MFAFLLQLIFILLQFQSLPESLSSLKSLAQQALGQNTPAPPGKQTDTNYCPVLTNLFIFSAGFLELGLSQAGAGGPPLKLQHKNEAHIPPLLGVAPLGVVLLSKEHLFQYRWGSMLNFFCKQYQIFSNVSAC